MPRTVVSNSVYNDEIQLFQLQKGNYVLQQEKLDKNLCYFFFSHTLSRVHPVINTAWILFPGAKWVVVHMDRENDKCVVDMLTLHIDYLDTVTKIANYFGLKKVDNSKKSGREINFRQIVTDYTVEVKGEKQEKSTLPIMIPLGHPSNCVTYTPIDDCRVYLRDIPSDSPHYEQMIAVSMNSIEKSALRAKEEIAQFCQENGKDLHDHLEQMSMRQLKNYLRPVEEDAAAR